MLNLNSRLTRVGASIAKHFCSSTCTCPCYFLMLHIVMGIALYWNYNWKIHFSSIFFFFCLTGGYTSVWKAGYIRSAQNHYLQPSVSPLSLLLLLFFNQVNNTRILEFSFPYSCFFCNYNLFKHSIPSSCSIWNGYVCSESLY